MKIIVKAKTNSKKESVKDMGEYYEVSVSATPVDGKANEKIIKLLAKHFGVAPSLVNITSGKTSKQKVFQIDK